MFFLLKVKLFDEEHELDLEESINAFLETINKNKLRDIQYTVAVAEDTVDGGSVFCFSALILYET